MDDCATSCSTRRCSFPSLTREALAVRKDDNNSFRPHSALRNLPLALYAKLSDPEKQRDGSLELLWGSAPRPVATIG